MMEACAKVGSMLHLPLNTERLRKLTENYVVSNEKIKKALGITQHACKSKRRACENDKVVLVNSDRSLLTENKKTDRNVLPDYFSSAIRSRTFLFPHSG